MLLHCNQYFDQKLLKKTIIKTGKLLYGNKSYKKKIPTRLAAKCLSYDYVILPYNIIKCHDKIKLLNKHKSCHVIILPPAYVTKKGPNTLHRRKMKVYIYVS